jgi:hypothetical protein
MVNWPTGWLRLQLREHALRRRRKNIYIYMCVCVCVDVNGGEPTDVKLYMYIQVSCLDCKHAHTAYACSSIGFMCAALGLATPFGKVCGGDGAYTWIYARICSWSVYAFIPFWYTFDKSAQEVYTYIHTCVYMWACKHKSMRTSTTTSHTCLWLWCSLIKRGAPWRKIIPPRIEHTEDIEDMERTEDIECIEP